MFEKPTVVSMSNVEKSNLIKEVFDYLLQEKQPYTIQDIAYGLRLKYAKTDIRQALDFLLKEKKIKEFFCGKMRTYLPNTNDPNLITFVFDYLVAQNRPYTVQGIVDGLHKEYGKTTTGRALDFLVSEGKIKEKSYGKQKIYFPDQTQFPDATDADIQAIEAEINAYTNSLNELNSQIKESETKLSSLNKSLTTEVAETKLNKLKDDIPKLKQKLDALESSSIKEWAAILVAKFNYTIECQRRKRMADSVIDAIRWPPGRAHLCELMGIKTVDDVILKKKLKI